MYLEVVHRAVDQPLMTADELYALPDDDIRHELLTGSLLAEPPIGYPHARLVARVTFHLQQHVRARGGGEVVAGDMGFILARDPDSVRAPDVAFISSARLEAASALTGFFPGPPDLAVEVLSPSERAGTIHGKVADYLAAGARMVWVIDPEAQTVSVFRSLLSPRTISGDQELSGEDVLPGFSIRVSELLAK